MIVTVFPIGIIMKRVSNTNNLGEAIRLERKRQELTQAQLAGLSGVGIRFLSELERGKDSCEIGKILHILKMLGLTLSINVESDG